MDWVGRDLKAMGRDTFHHPGVLQPPSSLGPCGMLRFGWGATRWHSRIGMEAFPRFIPFFDVNSGAGRALGGIPLPGILGTVHGEDLGAGIRTNTELSAHSANTAPAPPGLVSPSLHS